MSQGELTSCDNERETGSKNATNGKRLAHKKLLKYALRAEKMAESAVRADSTLCPTLDSPVQENATISISIEGLAATF